MNLAERFAEWRDRVLFGRTAAAALRQAEDRVAELEAIEAACQADVDAARASALARIDEAKTELRKTPRDRPRVLWPTPPHDQPPVSQTPQGPNAKKP